MAESKARIANARLGGLRCITLHGNPGTPEGRSKGGKTTIRLFNQYPVLAKKLGFIIRKEIKYPNKCAELAELIGIILGDGGLPGNHQLIISFNGKTDREYSRYLQHMLRKLFAVSCHIHYRKDNNGADIVVSSSNLVDFLVKQGLMIGNKVRNQVGIPTWIKKKLEYQKACLRGLIDTDGSFYCHKYINGRREYRYLKLCFTNCSNPLLNFSFNILKKLGYKVYLNGNHVSLYSTLDVRKYFTEIGTHNQKHLRKIQEFLYN